MSALGVYGGRIIIFGISWHLCLQKSLQCTRNSCKSRTQTGWVCRMIYLNLVRNSLVGTRTVLVVCVEVPRTEDRTVLRLVLTYHQAGEGVFVNPKPLTVYNLSLF